MLPVQHQARNQKLFGVRCRLLWMSLAALRLWRALSCRQLLTRQTVCGYDSTPRSPSLRTAMRTRPCMTGSSHQELDGTLIPCFCSFSWDSSGCIPSRQGQVTPAFRFVQIEPACTGGGDPCSFLKQTLEGASERVKCIAWIVQFHSLSVRVMLSPVKGMLSLSSIERPTANHPTLEQMTPSI